MAVMPGDWWLDGSPSRAEESGDDEASSQISPNGDGDGDSSLSMSDGPSLDENGSEATTAADSETSDGDDDSELDGGPRFDIGVPDWWDDDGGDDDPRSCEQAESERTYVGCEFWPTVTFNPVLTNFDFAVAVANASEEPATVRVERAGRLVAEVVVQPETFEKILLPWVDELKGPMFNAQTTGPRPKQSVRVLEGAYHVKSDVPITAWQFNPLQYAEPSDECALVQDINLGDACLSLSNDAALLIPTAAMRGAHRVVVKDSVKGSEGGYDDTPPSIAITATEDATRVRVQLPEGVGVAAGPGVGALAPGSATEFELDAGDVLQLMAMSGPWWGEAHHDLSGALITADAGIQVMATVALASVPSPEAVGQGYADHLEELVLPAESLGEHYLVAPPSSARGQNIGHFVRFVGNFDGTRLEYSGQMPAADAPRRLDAGEVATFGTDRAFEVRGSHAFAVAVFGRGGERHTPGQVPTVGDPAYSIAPAVAQFRSRYIFPAPVDYDASYADIILPLSATALLDGQPLQGARSLIEGTQWTLVREPLNDETGGFHRLESVGTDDEGEPHTMGLQVMGYGHATGYMYPGGLNLELISIPPTR